jgi:excinuclease ABC subunit C
LQSELDRVAGVGPKTRGKLLRAFGSVNGVIAATEDALIEAGATKRQARAIKDALGGAVGPPPNAESAEDTAIENAFRA